jgi:dipeptidyl aminopeptidase/acylaminoacyl peptidase
MAFLTVACEPVQGPEGPKAVATVTVTSPAATLQVGQQMTLAATLKSADGEELQREIAWASENAQRATVTSAGVVTGVAPGLVRIVATSEGKRGAAQLTIAVVPVAEVRLNVDEEVQLDWNGTAQLSAVALDANGVELPNRTVQWLSSKPFVAGVSAAGLVEARSAGTATVTAVIEGVPSSVGVRVQRAPVARVHIDAVTTDLEVGEVVTYVAQVLLVSGQIWPVPVTWSSSVETVARVTAGGPDVASIQALAEGSATITASAEGKSASVTVRTAPKPTHDLIYSRFKAGKAEILTLSLGTPGAAPVTLNAGTVSRDPSPSPDGTQFVFAVSQKTPMGEQQDDLYIVNRNGMNMRWLTRTDGIEAEPSWSPDGSRILFSRTFDNRTDLWTINVDGTGATNLTANLPATLSAIRNPAWSPDGGRIAFVAAQGGQHHIWTMNVNGSNVAQLTTQGAFNVSPTWSPSGDRIAFTEFNSATPENGWDVMIVAATGGSGVRLELAGDQLNPVWSPDGRYLAVQGNNVAGQGSQQLYTLRADGTGLRLRTVNVEWGGGLAPAWITRP